MKTGLKETVLNHKSNAVFVDLKFADGAGFRFHLDSDHCLNSEAVRRHLEEFLEQLQCDGNMQRVHLLQKLEEQVKADR